METEFIFYKLQKFKIGETNQIIWKSQKSV